MKIFPSTFADNQLGRLSEFTANLSLVFFASLVTPIFSGMDKINLIIVLPGILFTTGFLIISLLIERGSKSMNIFIDPLLAFFIAGGLLAIAIAILVYPTLKEKSKKK